MSISSKIALAMSADGASFEEVHSNLEKTADEFAIGFAHFLAEHTYSCYENGWSNDFGHKDLTTKELLEIYKKEK